mgnify:CR=1 FL=1
MNRRIRIYSHADFYRLPATGSAPKVGDIIRTNYGAGLATGYVVLRVTQNRDGYSFVCRTAAGSDSKNYYLNQYLLLGQRLVSGPYPPGSAGWHSNNGGLNLDGYDEIRIEQAALQQTLFDVDALTGA